MATALTIGDFSRMTHLSAKTLRHYHRVGLLEPAHVDPRNGYRYYTTDQVATAQVIRRFRDLDMPVDTVRAVLAAPDVGTRNALIGAHLDRLQAQLAETQAAVTSLQHLLGDPEPTQSIEYRSVPAVLTVAISATIERHEIGSWWSAAFVELYEVLRASGVEPAGAGGGLYASELFADDRGDATVFVPVAAAPAAGGRVGAARRAAGGTRDRGAHRTRRRHRPHLRRAGEARHRAGAQRRRTGAGVLRRGRDRHTRFRAVAHRDRLADLPDNRVLSAVRRLVGRRDGTCAVIGAVIGAVIAVKVSHPGSTVPRHVGIEGNEGDAAHVSAAARRAHGVCARRRLLSQLLRDPSARVGRRPSGALPGDRNVRRDGARERGTTAKTHGSSPSGCLRNRCEHDDPAIR